MAESTRDDWFSPMLERDEFGDESGLTYADLANAIQIWSIVRKPAPTVSEAADAFLVSEAFARQVIDGHYWMCVGPDGTIEHDGP